MLKYAIFGGNGKMGKEVISAAFNFAEVATLVKIFVSPREALIKQDALVFSPEEVSDLDFIIDFSTPVASVALAKALQGKDILIVCGTTGFTEEELEALKQAAREVKILYSANFSLGMAEIFKAAQNLAYVLAGYKVEITEKHHALKKDAPSGTALRIGQIIKNARMSCVNTIQGQNNLTEISYNVTREGDTPGIHEVSFKSPEERIWIGHEALKKEIFAKGSISIGVKAALNLKEKQNGFFNLQDVFHSSI